MKNDQRKVKFNVSIADYRPGQIVNYMDMPPGHRFWVDHGDILEASLICEFIDDIPASAVIKETLSIKSPDVDTVVEKPKEKTFDTFAKKKGRPSKKEKKMNEDSVSTTNQEVYDNPIICPGKNKNGTVCRNTKIMANGYCFFHQDQVPSEFSEETQENKQNIV